MSDASWTFRTRSGCDGCMSDASWTSRTRSRMQCMHVGRLLDIEDAFWIQWMRGRRFPVIKDASWMMLGCNLFIRRLSCV
jgi:hypothetical protein